MDLSTVGLFVVLGVMLSNQLVMRAGRKEVKPVPFWTLQAVDVVVAGLILTFGLPGFDAWPMIKWVVGLLLLGHVVQNLSLRQRWADEARRKAREAEEDALLEELRRAEDEGEPGA